MQWLVKYIHTYKYIYIYIYLAVCITIMISAGVRPIEFNTPTVYFILC